MSYETSRDVLLAALTGLAVGLAAVAFHWMMDMADFIAAVRNAPEGGFLHRWGRLLLIFTPAAGAVAGAVLLRFFAHERGSRGTDSAVWAYHRNGGRISSSAIPVKSTASVLTVGLGGSAGYEGPMTLIGAACGSTIARLLHLDARQRRILMAAGLAAGISALFRAPLAGAVFGAEIFYSSSDMEYETILPGFVASAVAYTVFCCFLGWEALLPMPAYVCESALKLPPFLALALVTALGARIYIGFFRTLEVFFVRRALNLPFWAKVALGGLATGAIGFFMPQIYGTSYDVIRAAFTTHDPFHAAGLDEMSFWAFLAMFFAKAAATSLTVASGGSGGVFAPALVCGASLGAATGVFFERILPDWIGINPGAFGRSGVRFRVPRTPRRPAGIPRSRLQQLEHHALPLPQPRRRPRQGALRLPGAEEGAQDPQNRPRLHRLRLARRLEQPRLPPLPWLTFAANTAINP